MIRRKAVFAALIVSAFAVVPATAQVKIDSTLAELERVVQGLENVESAIAKAWPTRDRDTANELTRPPQTDELFTKLDRLNVRRSALILRLQYAANDRRSIKSQARGAVPGELIAALRRARDLAFVEALVEAAGPDAIKSPEFVAVLLRQAKRHAPCPGFLADLLAKARSREAGAFLAAEGARTKSLRLLKSAGDTGDPAVIGSLIRCAKSRDRELSRAALDALARIVPPAARDPELEPLVRRAVQTTRSPELKATLVAYLAQTRNPENAGFFRQLYERERGTTIGLAAVGALGMLGETEASFLLEECRRLDTPPRAREACIRALGAARYKLAVPHLIDCLADPDVERAARRSLRQIAGRDIGPGVGPWLRWWRTQPEAGPDARDPDDL